MSVGACWTVMPFYLSLKYFCRCNTLYTAPAAKESYTHSHAQHSGQWCIQGKYFNLGNHTNQNP